MAKVREHRTCERCGRSQSRRLGMCLACVREVAEHQEARLAQIERFVERLKRGWEQLGKSIFEE